VRFPEANTPTGTRRRDLFDLIDDRQIEGDEATPTTALHLNGGTIQTAGSFTETTVRVT
jgi:hypothetical protein